MPPERKQTMKQNVFAVLGFAMVLTACPETQTTAPSADEVVRQALNLSLKAAHYRVTADAFSNATGELTTYTIEHQSPDRYHVFIPNGPEVIVIGEKIWGHDEDGWKPLGKANPDPRTVLNILEPGIVVGFVKERLNPSRNCDLYGLTGGKTYISVCVEATGLLAYLGYADDSGALTQFYDFKTAINIVPPI
jgi:hypothetical protein